MRATIERVYGKLAIRSYQSKRTQIQCWKREEAELQQSVDQHKGSHVKVRVRGVATVLSSDMEQEIVLWVNDLRAGGVPVSPRMLAFKAIEVVEAASIQSFNDPVMLLLDDFSRHWVKEATVYARSLNIVLAKVPPGLTWLCQPADAVWIKPMKDRLRRHWLLHHRARPTASTFQMKVPDQAKVAHWASDAWKDIPASMTVARFTHCKLGVGAVAVVEPNEVIEVQELLDGVIKDLEELYVVDPFETVLDDDQDLSISL